MRKLLLTTALTPLLMLPAAAQEEVEVLHWWTSGGEAAALNVLREALNDQGIGWLDMPVAGGGGEQAMTILRARVTAGNPPTAVQMLGFDILDWARQDVLGNLNDLAAEEGWNDVVPAALQAFSTHDGQWIAVPVNVHSTNWVWANRAIFDELGLSEPTTWDEFIAALDAIQAAGYIALAHGGQAWQDATIFDGVVMATGGPEFYEAALINLDEEALGSETMLEVFRRMEVLRGYVDDNFSGRDWNLATAMVIEGQAGVQMMGDWAKGEFLSAGLTPGEDFLCFRTPGTQGTVTFNSDQFVVFDVGEDRRGAQVSLASAVMSPVFQTAFNVVKGSVPARTDISDEEFDACGQRGMADLAEAAAGGTLFGSMAHGHAAPAAVKNAFYDVITAHFNGEFSAEDAVEELLAAIDDVR